MSPRARAFAEARDRAAALPACDPAACRLHCVACAAKRRADRTAGELFAGLSRADFAELLADARAGAK